MDREVSATDYPHKNQFRTLLVEQSPNHKRNFAQSLYALGKDDLLMEQHNQQWSAKMEASLNSQPSEQKISPNISLQTQDNFQIIFEQHNIGIALIATSGQFLRVNPYLCSLLQYSDSAMSSLTLQDITHTEDIQSVWQHIHQLFNGSQSHQSLEQRYLRQDGQWQLVNITLSLVNNSQNIPLYLIATIQDSKFCQQTETNLKTRLTIDTAIAQVSRKLIAIKEINYQEILEIIGKAVQCDHAYLDILAPKAQSYCTYHWSKDYPISLLHTEQIATIHQLPWGQLKLSRDEAIIISNIEQLSGYAHSEKNILQSLNICSALIIPILNPDGQVWGNLGLYNQGENERNWSQEDAQQLRILGEIIQSNYQYRINQTRLKAAEDLSASFFHHSVDGICLIETLPNNQLVYKATNPAFARLIGKTNQQIKGKTITEIIPSDIASIIEEKCHFCLATQKSLDFLLTSELQGRTSYWRMYLVPMENYLGSYSSLQVTVKDITEEKQALARQTRYRHLLRSITFKIRQSLDIQEILQTTVGELQKTFNVDRVLLFQFLPDGAGKVIKESVKVGFPSIAPEVILNEYGPDVLHDKYLEGYTHICEDTNNQELFSCHRTFLEKYQIKANLVLPIFRYLPIKNNTTSTENSRQTSDNLWGLLFVQQCSQSRQWNQNEIELLQHLVGQLTIALSQSELLESEITQRKELARSNAELEQFAYIASHDLQAPLQTVTNYVQLLQRRYQDQLDANGRKFIHHITDGIYRMRTQINDLLEYSRVGKERNTFRGTDYNLVVEQAISNLRSEIEKHQAVVTYCANLPTLVADSSQLVVLFQNLISNALKYHSQAIPYIKINACRQGNNWRFSVSDNGIGIDLQYKKRIFQIFQRLHTQEEYPGTGIGLAICQKIVERHGGYIEVDSQLKQGSTFYFTIPI